MHAQTILISSLLAASAAAYSPFLQGRAQTLTLVASAVAVAAAPAVVNAAPVVDASTRGLDKRVTKPAAQSNPTVVAQEPEEEEDDGFCLFCDLFD